jgi:(heptosyl)LPS beta-1,4-glucosyltransferase
MPAISVVICCANAAETLEPACRSVAWADELVIVDSGSTDATPQIAQRYAHRYVQERWRGYTGQKKYGAELCRHDWVFVLDGDEECSPQLAEQWKRISEGELAKLDVLLTPRKNYVMGRYVRAWWPDRQTRIFHRRRCTWPQEALHEARQPSHPSRVKELGGWIEHKRHSHAGFSDYFSGRRMDERLLMVARQMHERGKRARWWDLTLRPPLAFWKFYLLKAGFLDGAFGLLIAQKAAVSVQLKYAALWAVQQEQAPRRGPEGK